MCDTLYRKTPDGFIFGKNSDRSPNEPNLVEFHATASSSAPTRRLTYIDVEGQPGPHAVTIVRPSWMWGAEMGVNDAGVVIGNEAVFTRSRGKKVERLTGMDLLRLALEKAPTAKEAVTVIASLLERYGQGGNCGFDKPFYYDNSFLVAGPDGAYVLETSGREWVVKAIADHGNISNMLALDHEVDSTSGGACEHFARRHREPVFTFFAKARRRSCQAASALAPSTFGVLDMMALLRSHVDKDVPHLFDRGSVRSLCMHKTALGDHTTGSFIHQHRPLMPVTWITGSSTPCLSLYKPTYFGAVVPPVFTTPQESLTYWLDREYLIRAVYAGFVDLAAYRDELNSIQKAFVEGDVRLVKRQATPVEFFAFQKACADREHSFVEAHREAIDRLAENPLVTPQLPPPWRVRTAVLGDNVFAPTLKERISGR